MGDLNSSLNIQIAQDAKIKLFTWKSKVWMAKGEAGICGRHWICDSCMHSTFSGEAKNRGLLKPSGIFPARF